MNFNNKSLKLALSVLSGRKTIESLDSSNLYELGLTQDNDWWKFNGKDFVEQKEKVLWRCEILIFDAMENLSDRLIELE